MDDGSRDMEMSGAMLEQAWSEGIRAIIATPHSHAFRQPEKVIFFKVNDKSVLEIPERTEYVQQIDMEELFR